MKLSYLSALLLPLAASAAPVTDSQDTSPEAIGLEKRGAQSCKIINVSKGNYVNCHYSPTLDGGEIFGFHSGDELTFACWKKGPCYKGNCTWDQVTYIGTTCYVNGYFTSSNCSSKKLPKCD